MPMKKTSKIKMFSKNYIAVLTPIVTMLAYTRLNSEELDNI